MEEKSLNPWYHGIRGIPSGCTKTILKKSKSLVSWNKRDQIFLEKNSSKV